MIPDSDLHVEVALARGSAKALPPDALPFALRAQAAGSL